MNIRRLLVEFIRNLPEDGDRNWMQFMTPNREQYLEAMNKFGGYGDDSILNAAAEFFGVNITVLHDTTLIVPYLCPGATVTWCLVLHSDHGGHFNVCNLDLTSILKRRLLISDAFSPPGIEIGMHAYT